MVNTLLSKSSQESIKKLQDVFTKQFPEAVWTTPADTLHITLFDWLAPLVNYGNDKDVLFDEIYREYGGVLSDILNKINPVNLTFSKIIISPSAVAIVADDKSTEIFNKIRQDFLAQIKLLPNTKQPPNIVHSTIVRFVDEIDLGDVRQLANSLDFSFNETVDNFQLVRETKLPMLEYSVVNRYLL